MRRRGWAVRGGTAALARLARRHALCAAGAAALVLAAALGFDRLLARHAAGEGALREAVAQRAAAAELAAAAAAAERAEADDARALAQRFRAARRGLQPNAAEFGPHLPSPAAVPSAELREMAALAARAATEAALALETGAWAPAQAAALRPLAEQLARAADAAIAARPAPGAAWGLGGAWRAAAAVAVALLALLAAQAVLLARAVPRAPAPGPDEEGGNADPLTGMPRRRALLAALEDLLARGVPVAVVAIHLDRLREANEMRGEAAGDALIREAAARIRGSLRGFDVLGRLGGDEFAAVLVGTGSAQGALEAAERLRVALHLPASHRGAALRMGATIGVAVAPGDATTAQGLLAAAEEAMRRAKAAARGSVRRASAEAAAGALRAAAIARAVTSAECGPLEGLSAHLQPIVELSDGAPSGLEALARWTPRGLGQIPPTEMFAAAERLGVAHLLSREVRAKALSAFAELRREGIAPGRLSFNLSLAELLQPDLFDTLEAQLAGAGLDMGCVVLEITEDALLERLAGATLGRLVALRERGARLALDDFGTGTSGLSQLLGVPLDIVKLDRTFTTRLGSDGRAEKVVEATVRLAHSLGLSVVAEGVEDEGQAQTLRLLGCDLGQGWLWGRAMPPEELRPWLRARARPAAGKVVPLRPPAGGQARA